MVNLTIHLTTSYIVPTKMWLINTTTLGLEYFAVPEKAPSYAILSHTWGDGELSFAEFRSLEDSARAKGGFDKISKTCELAKESNIPYAWVDTCCIDKSSSAELTEAINSMYDYYRRSEICYVYIDDWGPEVEWGDLIALGDLESEPDAEPQRTSEAQSTVRANQPLRWFTRGWTLQELIAPKQVEFYDASWLSRGFKHNPEVTPCLSRITGITSEILEKCGWVGLDSVALGQRMSWAAYRETSRVEDTAYCLMGIFKVSMPLLYGEGSRAFLRLQQEIIKNTTDLSIFAWAVGNDHGSKKGIFSTHPRQFSMLKTCSLRKSQFSPTESEITITNRGLRIHTTPFKFAVATSGSLEDLIFLDLGCTTHDPTRKRHFLHIYQLSGGVYSRGATTFRIDDSVCGVLERGKAQVLYVVQSDDSVLFNHISLPHIARREIAMCFTEYIGNNNAPYSLRRSLSWPLSHTSDLASYDGLVKINLTGLPWFMGYVKFDIVPKTHYNVVASVVAVYEGTEKPDDVSITLLQGEAAHNFVKFTNHAETKMDAFSAEATLSQLMLEHRKGGVIHHLDVEDTARSKSIRIFARFWPKTTRREEAILIGFEEIERVL